MATAALPTEFTTRLLSQLTAGVTVANQYTGAKPTIEDERMEARWEALREVGLDPHAAARRAVRIERERRARQVEMRLEARA